MLSAASVVGCSWRATCNNRRVNGAPGGGVGCFRAGELTWRDCGPFQRDGGDEGGGMPIPRVVRQWNKAGLNRVTKRVFPWMPGLGVVIHRGRNSGRVYQTPVNVFATEDGYVFALTYGPDTDWVKNILAAGGCELRTRGRVIRL